MKKIIFVLATLFTLAASFAQTDNSEERQNHFDLSLTTSFAYYFQSDYKSGGTHFAPITSPCDGVGLAVKFDGKYVMPFGDKQNFLFSSNNAKLGTSLELTPVTATFGLNASIKPIAFLEFSAGTDFGTGWKFLGFEGFSYFNPATNELEQVDGFKTWYLKTFCAATFMFDFEVLFPGEWHHIVTLVNYELSYNCGLNKPDNGEVFRWQREANQTDGIKQKFNFLLGYQMPLKLSLVGVAFGFNGYLATSSLSDIYSSYNAKFTSFSITPLAQIDLTEKDKLSVAMAFATRRSFKEDHDEIDIEPRLTECGSEWFFDYIGLSWTHKF